MIYRKFKINDKYLAALSSEDRRVIKILEEAVKDIARIYQLQLKEGFYPIGVTKEEVEKAATHNSAILAPFTQVFRNNDGGLDAIPYYQKYSQYLEPVAQKIDQAADISHNSSFKKYLQARAKALRDGSYKDADIAWLKVKDSIIDFNIGPVERYMDKLLFIKRSFQAHLGVIDIDSTQKASDINEVLYSSAKLSFEKSHSTEIPHKGVSVFVEEVLSSSGFVADICFSGEHFPADLEVMQQYGSKIIIYSQHLQLKFKKMHYPIFKALFEPRFAAKYSADLLLKANVWNILLYESGRQLHKFIGSRERLQELYGIIDEANSATSGVEHAKYLVMKGTISQDELESIIIMHIVQIFTSWLIDKQNGTSEDHVRGGAIDLNNYLSSGALREQKGISWPNFSRIFFEIELLANELVQILQRGTYKEAERFVIKNTGLENLQKLGTNLEKLKLSI